MADNDELHARVLKLIGQASQMLAQCETLERRIDAFSTLLPPGNDVASGGTARIQAMLIDFHAQTLADLKGITLQTAPSLEAIAEHIEEIASRINALPDDIDGAIEAKLADAREEFAERAGAAMEQIETTYAETREKLADASDRTFDQLKEELDEAHDKLAGTVTRVKEAISGAEQDVRRIVTALERTRDTVLSACRAAGVGAQAAAPALQAATSVFSAVN